jgi:hypothetical protein
MQSTMTPQDTDPHDAFVIEPDVVLAARQASSDPVQELLSHLAQKAAKTPPEVSVVPQVSTVAPQPAADTTFRAAAIGTIDTKDRPVAPNDRPGIGWWVKRAFVAFLFALCSAFAAAAWKHQGDTARQMISSWLPPFVLAALPINDKPAADKTAAAEQPPDPAPVQAAAADPAPAQPASPAPAQTPTPPSDAATATVAAAPAQPAPSTPATLTSPSTPATSTQSMAHDLATMGQQIEQLKASIEQLKASQAQMSRELAKNSEPSPRPRASALPQRPVAALAPRPIPAQRKPPRQAYLPPPPVITSPQPAYAVPPPLPPPAQPQSITSQPVMSQPAPLPEATASDDGPVIRPPMPLR